MILASSDIDLTSVLSRWELGEYFFAGLVTVACLGEYVADFSRLFTGGVPERKERFARGSTLLLIAALALELVCLVRTNQISARVIGSLGEM